MCKKDLNRHVGLESASRTYWIHWIPAFAGMTAKRQNWLFTRLSNFKTAKFISIDVSVSVVYRSSSRISAMISPLFRIRACSSPLSLTFERALILLDSFRIFKKVSTIAKVAWTAFGLFRIVASTYRKVMLIIIRPFNKIYWIFQLALDRIVIEVLKCHMITIFKDTETLWNGNQSVLQMSRIYYIVFACFLLTETHLWKNIQAFILDI